MWEARPAGWMRPGTHARARARAVRAYAPARKLGRRDFHKSGRGRGTTTKLRATPRRFPRQAPIDVGGVGSASAMRIPLVTVFQPSGDRQNPPTQPRSEDRSRAAKAEPGSRETTRGRTPRRHGPFWGVIWPITLGSMGCWALRPNPEPFSTTTGPVRAIHTSWPTLA